MSLLFVFIRLKFWFTLCFIKFHYLIHKKCVKQIYNYICEFINPKLSKHIIGFWKNRNKIITGISQGSVLGLLFFNIFINDLFLFENKSEICNYADDNTLYAANKNINHIINNLSNDFRTLTNWLCDNTSNIILWH